MMRLSYDMWPQYNRRLREVIAALTGEKLAIRPSADGFRRDPTWAGRTISTIRANRGHGPNVGHRVAVRLAG